MKSTIGVEMAILQKRMTRNQAAQFYAQLIVKKAPDFIYSFVNLLIIHKWSESGLIYIKERAWKIAETTKV